MDESWRMRMGMPTPPSPLCPQQPIYHLRRPTVVASSIRCEPNTDDFLNPEDFSDVFGGPPRTILSRQFSSGYPRSSSSSPGYFYEEIFKPSEKVAPPSRRSGRSLPEFRMPGHHQKREKNGFYSDIFGSDDERVVRSRSRSKTSSSSVLSSEELSPLRPAFSFNGGGGDEVSSFASKLRPINVRWNSIRLGKDQQNHQNMMPPCSSNHHHSHNAENPNNLRSYPFGFNQRNASPETISLEPISNGSFGVSADDMEVELNSPSSAVSSVCHSLCQEGRGIEVDDDNDEAMSSYVIEINSDNNREGTCESNGVDEAIAWAKEKSQTHYSEIKWSGQECEATEKTTQDFLDRHQVSEGGIDGFGSSDNQQVKWEIVEDEGQCSLGKEMKILDEKIRLWSSGKDADIRLLLSSLHHILWPNSGWLPVPVANIIETSEVKKSYQKARLCLHPDKLQQRGATPQQKYIADKTFSILQVAWTAFITLDVF